MDVQAGFDKVILKGFYNEQHNLMCHSLKAAARLGIITKDEFVFANTEIRKYLGGFGSLGGLLGNKEQDWSFTARLAIYKDWANKPKFKVGD